jgi:hypothetical protein
MTTNISRPFPIDTKIHPAVVAAKEQLAALHRTNVAAAKVGYENKLEQRWEEAERKRKADFLARWRYDNPPVRLPNPHSDLNDAGVVRVMTVPEDRIKVLGDIYTSTTDIAFLIESLRCWLYRRKSQAPIPDVKRFLKEWIPVDGTDEIYTESTGEHFVSNGPVGHGKRVPHTDRRVIAFGLSVELANVLQRFTVQRGVVWFAGAVEFEDRPGIRGERITPAHRMPDEYPPSEY